MDYNVPPRQVRLLRILTSRLLTSPICEATDKWLLPNLAETEHALATALGEEGWAGQAYAVCEYCTRTRSIHANGGLPG